MELNLILASGVLALLYGLWTIRSVLSLPAGNARMQEIAAAIQEGAQAYLNRQYVIIAAVAVPLAVVLLLLQDWKTALGFVIGAVLSGVLAGEG